MRIQELLVRNWTLKLTALVLAILLWTVIKADEPTRVEIPEVPIEVVLQDPAWALAAPPAPMTATVVFSGPVRELVRLAVQRPRVIVLVDTVQDTVRLQPLRASWVQMDADLQRTHAEDVRPGSVLLFFERLETRVLPVEARLRGKPPAGYELAGPAHVDPPAVRISGPAQRLEALGAVRLQPIDLSELREPVAVPVEVDTTGLDGLTVTPRQVEVYLPVVPVEPEEAAPDSLDAAPPRPDGQ